MMEEFKRSHIFELLERVSAGAQAKCPTIKIFPSDDAAIVFIDLGKRKTDSYRSVDAWFRAPLPTAAKTLLRVVCISHAKGSTGGISNPVDWEYDLLDEMEEAVETIVRHLRT